MYAALLLAALATPSNVAESGSFAIRADTVWLGDGRTMDHALVVVEDGKIQRVEAGGEPPEGFEFFEHKGALSAGLVALRTRLGLGGEASDPARVALPEARVGFAFAPEARDFELARAAGVTTVVLAPDSQGICSGSTAVVKTFGRAVLAPRGHLVLGMGLGDLGFNREPTSSSGQVAMLEALFQKPVGAIEDAASGKLPCYFEVASRGDVARAVAFARKHELTGALVGPSLPGDVAEEIKSAKLAVVLPMWSTGVDRRELRSVVELAKAGVPFGFTGDAPEVPLSALRGCAALLVREGVDPQIAWSSLTSAAARIAGVGDRVGRIAKGCDADLVLWSGSPLDLTSKIEVVYVDGVRVAGENR